MMPPVCLSIAGSDPSGGAGIQADLKTFHRHGVYGAAAIALLTVQNSTGTKSVEVMPPELVSAQVLAVLDDLPVRAVKTGALGNADVVKAVAECLRGRNLSLVVDTVMAAKNGLSLLGADATEAAKASLYPMATLLTPNLDEASILVGGEVRTISDMKGAGSRMRDRFGCAAVLVKGGHLEGDDLVDVLCDADGVVEFVARRIETVHTRGTGCTYSAAITAHLAQGIGLRESVSKSHAWLQKAIGSALANGTGRGGLNHFA
jgi:hydroxymethylpyrimidine/phosphomethylpyrimidine kinase